MKLRNKKKVYFDYWFALIKLLLSLKRANLHSEYTKSFNIARTDLQELVLITPDSLSKTEELRAIYIKSLNEDLDFGPEKLQILNEMIKALEDNGTL